MGWNKSNRPEPQKATGADDSRTTSSVLPCKQCGAWVPFTKIDDHAPCNGKDIDPRTVRR